jgi:hypothetical protein
MRPMHAQERGELARPGRISNVRSLDISPTLDDIGIDRRRLSEWHDLRLSRDALLL